MPHEGAAAQAHLPDTAGRTHRLKERRPVTDACGDVRGGEQSLRACVSFSLRLWTETEGRWDQRGNGLVIPEIERGPCLRLAPPCKPHLLQPDCNAGNPRCCHASACCYSWDFGSCGSSRGTHVAAPLRPPRAQPRCPLEGRARTGRSPGPEGGCPCGTGSAACAER